MTKRSVPKAVAARKSPISNAVAIAPASKKLVFSFESLERNKYFDIDLKTGAWASELFDMMKVVSGVAVKELMAGSFKTFRVHSHENAHPPCPLPAGVELKDFYQIRLSKSKGCIHGVFQDNVFYVMWFDPLHNMYPDEHYGGLKEVNR